LNEREIVAMDQERFSSLSNAFNLCIEQTMLSSQVELERILGL
jgi:hypothetical protein